MSDSPAEAPQYPPGYMEANNGNQVIAVASIFLILGTILFALRLYARSLTQASRGWDEFLLWPSYICLVGLAIVQYLDVIYYGLGRHSASVMAEDPKKIVNYAKLLYILFWFYVPSNALSRVSVVALYLRIFTSQLYRSMCWFVIAVLLGNMITTLVTASLECFPLAYTWDKSIPGGRCINQMLWYVLTNVIHVIQDVMILVLPIPTVWDLKASTGKRAGIAMVFLMGSIGLFSSCMRTGIFFRDSHIIAKDPTWGTEVMCWTIVECGMYFVAACLIGMRPLLSKLPRWFRDRTLHSSDRGTAGQGSRSGTGLGFNKGPSHRPYSSLSGGRDTPGQAIQLKSMKSMNAMTSTIVSPRGSRFDDDSVRNLVADYGDIRVQTRIEVKSDRSQY